MSRITETGPNPLPPDQMRPLERRAELCRLLALGVIRLHMRDSAQPSAQGDKFRLHSPPDQSGHATTQNGDTA